MRPQPVRGGAQASPNPELSSDNPHPPAWAVAPDYDVEWENAWMANIEKVQRGDVSDKRMKRLVKDAARYRMTVEEVLAECAASKVAAAAYATDPAKQNLAESLFNSFVEQFPQELVADLVRPSNGGGDALYLIGTSVVRKDEAGNRELKASGAKSVDFTFRCGDHQVFVSHKWTREAGGTQDHQAQELANFLTAGGKISSYDGRPAVFIAVADGAYYEHTARDGNSWFDRNKLADNCFAVSSPDLPALLAQLADVSIDGLEPTVSRTANLTEVAQMDLFAQAA